MPSPTFAKVADRIRGILHNHPRSQYVRLTKDEAQAVIAAAPPPCLGFDTSEDTDKVLRRYLHRALSLDRDADDVTKALRTFLTTDRYQRQELRRYLEGIDRALDTIASWATGARTDLRHGCPPAHVREGFSTLDTAWKDYRAYSIALEAAVNQAIAMAYAYEREAQAKDAET